VSEHRATLMLTVIGVPIGFAASLLGLGGGIFAGPYLHFRSGFELKRATGTALVVVLATTVASTLTELFRTGSPLRWGVALALVGGALVGARLGFLFSERVPERTLRALFAVLLVVLAARVLLASRPQWSGTASLSIAEYAGIVAVGVAGGFVSPVLGVGGGLVMLPGVLLVAGGSYDAARAASLVAGAVAAGQGLLLKSSVRRVSWPHGLLFGAGAVAGASSAVLSIERVPIVLEIARISLAVLLVWLALRFSWDALRLRGAP
jgi:uncharacterized membrane protein YfcA